MILMGMLCSCSWIMHHPDEEERVAQPPPGVQKSSIPHNSVQKFEADSALGGAFTNPRR